MDSSINENDWLTYCRLTTSMKREQRSWSRHFERARVSYAAAVERCYVLETDSQSVQGRPEGTMASCYPSNISFQIFLARDFSADSQSSIAAVVEMISQQFEFKDPLIIHLLYTLFIEKDLGMVLRVFGRQGFQVDGEFRSWSLQAPLLKVSHSQGTGNMRLSSKRV